MMVKGAYVTYIKLPTPATTEQNPRHVCLYKGQRRERWMCGPWRSSSVGDWSLSALASEIDSKLVRSSW